MTVIKKNIGRLPVNLGDYDSNRSYGRKNRVFLYGCEWESKSENNTYAPATLNESAGVITPDTTHWRHVSGSYEMWLVDHGYGKISAANVKDAGQGNKTQQAINAEVGQKVSSLEKAVGSGGTVDQKIAVETQRAQTVEGAHNTRIVSLEGAVGSGGSVDSRIDTAKSEIKGNATSACDTLGKAEGLISAETARAKAAEENLRTLYNNLQQSQPVPVTELPAEGEAGKIYRLAGESSYADYMYNEDDLTTPIKMAEYDNAIDDEPTAGSDNLVKSGGTKKQLNKAVPAIFKRTDAGYTFFKYKTVSGHLYYARNTSINARCELKLSPDTSASSEKQNLPSVAPGGTIKFRANYDYEYIYIYANAALSSVEIIDSEIYNNLYDLYTDNSLVSPLSENLVKTKSIIESLDNKQDSSLHIIVYKGHAIDVWHEETLGNYILNTDYDVSELIFLHDDTTLVTVNGNFIPFRYIWFRKDGTILQNGSPYVQSESYAVRLLFTHGDYDDYTGLRISQNGGYQKASDCKFDYHIPISQVKTGKYYNLVSNSVSIIENNASKYLEPIDVSKFKGKYVEINISNYLTTTSGRAMAVVNESYQATSAIREARPTEVSGNVATYRLVINNDILLISWSLAFDIKSIVIKDAMNIGDALDYIYSNMSDSTEKDAKVYSKEVSSEWFDGYVDNGGNFIDDASSLQRITDFINVEPGMRIQVRYSAVVGRLPVTMYSDNSISDIILSECIEGDGSTHLDIITIPDGVNYIRLSHDSRGGADNLFNPYILGDMEIIKYSIPLASSINKQWLRLHKTAPKKPVIAFEMDMNNYSAANAIAYIDKLESYGVQGSTFFTFPTLNWTSVFDFQKVLREIHARGHEIALHSLPGDGTGATTTAPQATEEEFRTFMKTYFDWFAKYGFYPTGWVTTQGKLYDELLPLVEEYMCYAHTLPNGNWNTEQATDYIVPRTGDRYTFKRYGYEMGASGTAEQETELINKIKAGVDAAVANNGMLILYCHSYNEDRADYTLRDSVLTAVLDYIKPLIDSYRIVTGNVQDLVEYFFD